MSQAINLRLLIRLVFVSILSLHLVVAVIAAPSSADGTEWTSQVGKITYEKTIKNTAVFKYKTPGVQNSSTWLFINNAVNPQRGNLPDRGSFSGYWMEDSNRTLCEAALVNPMGTRSHSWGRFEITFIEDAIYPNWSGSLGDCFEQPSRILKATKLAGNSGADRTNYLITANSVGDIRLGMTVADARKVFEKAAFTRWEGYSDVWVDIEEGGRSILKLTVNEKNPNDEQADGNTPVDDSATITEIEISDSRYKSADGVHVGMTISEAENRFGKIEEITYQMDPRQDTREQAEFSSQPKTFYFTVAANAGAATEDAKAGIYPSDYFATSRYIPGAVISSIRVASPKTTEREFNYMLTENSAGDIFLGMSVAAARMVFKGAKFEQYDESEEGRWIDLNRGEKTLLRVSTDQKYTEPDNEGLVPIDESAKIVIIEISDPRYKSLDGVHVGMALSDAERKFGGIRKIEYWGLDGSEHPEFFNQPGYSFEIALGGDSNNPEARAGIYDGDEVETKRYVSGAVISVIELESGNNEDLAEPEPRPSATVNTPGDVLNMRTIPNHRTGFLMIQIPDRGRVTIENCETAAVRIGRRRGHWCRVSYQGVTGWVFDAFLVRDQ